MIKNFEARYQSILEPKTKDLDGTSSHHKQAAKKTTII